MTGYLLFVVPKGPKLSKAELQTVVDICIGVGLVGFGSIVVPTFLIRGNVFQIIAGLTISITFWYIALRTARKIT